MNGDVLALFLEFPGPAFWMTAAAAALLAIGLAAARKEIAKARRIEKVGALTYLCYGLPLAVFGTEHFVIPNSLLNLVPRYMPSRMFWVYFVGCALIGAGLSIATKRLVRWSGLLVGILMLLFVAMLYLPGAIRVGGRFPWTIASREGSFGGAGLVLAGVAMGGRDGKRLIAAGRVLIAIAAVFFGIEHFLHPLGMPCVPLQKQMPGWVPVRHLIGYLTGALLVVTGACFVFVRKTRIAAICLGAWIVFLVVVIYVPVMVAALASSNAGVQIEGINYFADTLLFGGAILSVSRAK